MAQDLNAVSTLAEMLEFLRRDQMVGPSIQDTTLSVFGFSSVATDNKAFKAELFIQAVSQETPYCRWECFFLAITGLPLNLVEFLATLIRNNRRVQRLHIRADQGVELTYQDFYNLRTIIDAFAQNHNGIEKEVMFLGTGRVMAKCADMSCQIANLLGEFEKLQTIRLCECEEWFVKTMLQGVSNNGSIRRVDLVDCDQRRQREAI